MLALEVVIAGSDADHGLAMETQLAGIRDRHDLHNSGISELSHSLTHGGFAQPHPFADFGIGHPTIALEEPDDFFGHIIQAVAAGLL